LGFKTWYQSIKLLFWIKGPGSTKHSNRIKYIQHHKNVIVFLFDPFIKMETAEVQMGQDLFLIPELYSEALDAE